jgi:hypothetical protein
MAAEKKGLAEKHRRRRFGDTRKLIHEFRNCVHQINMELDLAERGLVEEPKYVDLISAVDSMNCSLEDLRARLVRMEENRRREKSIGD